MSDLGDTALGIAEAAYQMGVKEHGGIHRGPEVDQYLAGCVRHGARLGLVGMNWCASFASWCIWHAWAKITGIESYADVSLHWSATDTAPPLPPVGYRAAVSELVSDAKATGTWHDVSEGYQPELGDLCILARAGEDPRSGGLGHVCLVAGADKGQLAAAAASGPSSASIRLGGSWDCIGGNQGSPGAVTLVTRSLADKVEPIVGWIALGRAGA